ncbi:MAG: GNAT family N-acetyltransferase [Pseudomonadota bacterium]
MYSNIDIMKITFEKATHKHQQAIFNWLKEPHVQEFWDNTQAHKDDIINFMEGRKEPSDYADGRYVYWVGLVDDQPYSLIMTIKMDLGEERVQLKADHLSKIGKTYGLEYMIGDKRYIGKGLGAKTLALFVEFFRKVFDECADTSLIDPDFTNPRAKHVYEKAGFIHVGDFIMGGNGCFAGRESHLLAKKLQGDFGTSVQVCGKYRSYLQTSQLWAFGIG